MMVMELNSVNGGEVKADMTTIEVENYVIEVGVANLSGKD